MKTGLPPAAAPIERNLKFFIYGLVGTEEVDLRSLCPSGVSSIHQKAGFGDICLSTVTAGIYTPRTVEITCAAGTAYQMDIDAEGKVTRLAKADSTKEVVR